MQDKLTELKSILAEVSDLYKAASVLGWDQQTYMPRAGAEARGQQLGTLGKIAHEKFIDEKVGKLLDELKDTYHPESDEYALIRVTRRNYDKSTRVPAEFVAEQAQVTAAAHEGWVEARTKSDYSIFQPHLEKVDGPDPPLHRFLPQSRPSLRHPARRLRARHEDRRGEGDLHRTAQEAGAPGASHRRTEAGG